jgi:two-component system, chemotaxis family, response regulator Rcp1
MKRDTVGRPMEILLVEDSLVDARFAIAALQKSQIKHRLTLVRDGEEALEFVGQLGKFSRAPRPDLILLDLLMPKKDGIEVLTELKQDYNLKNIPVVIMTGSDAQEDMVKCELLHVDSFISKPVNIEKFLSVVKQLKSHWLHDVILPAID